MAISDSNESGYAKKRVLWRRENKANSQKRDCRVASLLAMTARGREPIVENKANLRFRPVWTTWAHRCTIGKLALAAATPRRNRIVRNKANFGEGEMVISDSKDRGYEKHSALWARENKANSQSRDCRVASLLAMTGRSRELIVPNKANFYGGNMQNKPNLRGRDCFGASLLAMTGRSRELVVRNKANFGGRDWLPCLRWGRGPAAGGGGFCGEVRRARKARRPLDLTLRGGILSGRFGQGRSERGHNAACS